MKILLRRGSGRLATVRQNAVWPDGTSVIANPVIAAEEWFFGCASGAKMLETIRVAVRYNPENDHGRTD